LRDKSQWQTNSLVFGELEVAKFWGVLPSVYRSATDQDKVEMIAYMESHAEMRAVEEYQVKKKLDEQRRRNKSRTG
jgi:hypothetical protein